MGDAGRGREEQGDVRGQRHFSVAVLPCVPGGRRQLLLAGEREAGGGRARLLHHSPARPGETFFFFVGELIVVHGEEVRLE